MFTFVNYKLVKKSTTVSGLSQAIKIDYSDIQVIKGVSSSNQAIKTQNRPDQILILAAGVGT